MKNLSFLLLITLLFSCSGNSIPDKIAKKITAGEEVLAVNPDSALHIINEVMYGESFNKLNDKSQLSVYLLKEKVFSKKRVIDSILHYSKKIRIKAKAINDSASIVQSLLYIVGDVDGSVRNELERELPIYVGFAERNKMYYEAAKLSSMYGIILASKGETNSSQPYLLKSYHILDSLGYKKELIPICNAVGSNFSEFNNHPQTLFYYRKGVEIAEELKDSTMLPSLLINIGIDYFARKMQDSATWYYNKAMLTIPIAGGDLLRIKLQYNRYMSMYSNNNLNEAIGGFHGLLEECKKLNFPEGVAVMNKAIGIAHKEGKVYDSARYYLQESIKMAEELKDYNLKLTGTIELERVYENSGDFAAAYALGKENEKFKDSVFSNEKEMELVSLENNFQLDKKEMENSFLRDDIKNDRLFMGLLFALILSMIVMIYKTLKSGQYLKERNRSYEKLIEKYAEERKERDSLVSKEIISSNTLTSAPSLYNTLNTYFEEEKPFLIGDLKIEQVAEATGISQKDILQLLKDNDFKSFNSYVNYYRVKEVRRLFEDPAHDHVKLDAIGNMAGFRAKQTFYLAFETNTGMKPGFYRRHIKS